MTPNSTIVRKYLIDMGVISMDLKAVWAPFISHLPDKPDNAICFFDTQGTQDGRIMATGERIDHPGIMIMVRGLIYVDAWRKAREIALKLDEAHGSVVAVETDDTYIVQNISRTGDILNAGMEEVSERRRYHFTVNAVVTIKKEE